jgi:hypothetical protein
MNILKGQAMRTVGVLTIGEIQEDRVSGDESDGVKGTHVA